MEWGGAECRVTRRRWGWGVVVVVFLLLVWPVTVNEGFGA